MSQNLLPERPNRVRERLIAALIPETVGLAEEALPVALPALRRLSGPGRRPCSSQRRGWINPSEWVIGGCCARWAGKPGKRLDMDAMDEIRGGDPTVRNAWTEFVPFLDYDVEIRRMICSTTLLNPSMLAIGGRSALGGISPRSKRR
jgi:hypothetical protein